MGGRHTLRLLAIEGDMATVQGPPVPRWLIDLVTPYAPGIIQSVMVCGSRTEVEFEDETGEPREVIITGQQWDAMGGPAAMRAHGYVHPITDDWHD